MEDTYYDLLEAIISPFSSLLVGRLDNGKDCPETLLWEVVNRLGHNPCQQIINCDVRVTDPGNHLG